MLDLYTVADMFSNLEGCLQGLMYDSESGERDANSLLGQHQWFLPDGHLEADRWLSADYIERERLGAIAASRLALVIKENSRNLVTREQRAAYYAERQRAYRLRNLDYCKEQERLWRESHREYRRLYAREYRAGLRTDPARAAKYRQRELERMRRFRASRKAAMNKLNPPKPKMSASEKHLKKLESNRKYRKSHKKTRTYTLEQLAAKREYQRTKYRALSEEAKRIKLAKKRDAWSKRLSNERKAA